MTVQAGILETLIEAINLNTAALKAAQSPAATSTTAEPVEEKAEPKKAEPKKAAPKKAAPKKAPASEHSRAEVTEAIVALKEAKGTAAAKSVLSDNGFAKLADITEEKYDDLYAAAVELMPGEDEGDAEEEDDI